MSTLLPIDIICELFYAAAEIDVPLAGDAARDRAGSLGWITLTHVCALWRQVGLDLPKLWAGIIFNLPTAFDTVLERARDVVLTLNYDHYRGLRAPLPEARHFQLLGRAETINDHSALRPWSTLLGNFHEMPHLRSFRLLQNNHNQQMQVKVATPSLRFCELIVNGFPFASAPQLTVLKLHDKSSRLAHPTWKPLLAILSVCPALMSLYIDAQTLPESSSPLNRGVYPRREDDVVVRLLHLASMSIKLRVVAFDPYPASELGALLEMVELPATTCSSIGFTTSGENPYPRLLSTLTSQLTLPGRDTLAIAVAQSDGMYIAHDEPTRSRQEVDVTLISICEGPAVSLSNNAAVGVSFLTDRHYTHRSLPPLLSSLAPVVAPSIRTLLVRDSVRNSAFAIPDAWDEEGYWDAVTSGLRLFPHITTLHFQTWADDALSLLKTGPNAPLPALETVIVDHLWAVNGTLMFAFWSELAALLAARAAAGHSVQRLVLRGPKCVFASTLQYIATEVSDERTERPCTCGQSAIPGKA
ncbi:hypothetical protein PENSPDRAFT_655749 [Peniophora sp. CONT]|nr:hypothetical protein PENSPDRAFT_655749 [Peniophora sp. CONT]